MGCLLDSTPLMRSPVPVQLLPTRFVHISQVFSECPNSILKGKYRIEINEQKNVANATLSESNVRQLQHVYNFKFTFNSVFYQEGFKVSNLMTKARAECRMSARSLVNKAQRGSCNGQEAEVHSAGRRENIGEFHMLERTSSPCLSALRLL